MESVLSAEKFSFVFASFCSVVRSYKSGGSWQASFLSTDLTTSCPASLPVAGGYGFGLLFPLGGRLGGKIFPPLAVTALSCQNLAGYEIPVLQIAAAYHHERGCLYPAQREHPLPGSYAQRLGGVYPYQPVRFAAGLGREVKVIVTLSRLQVIQPLTDCLVGKAAYPQAHKWFPAVQVMEDIAED